MLRTQKQGPKNGSKFGCVTLNLITGRPLFCPPIPAQNHKKNSPPHAMKIRTDSNTALATKSPARCGDLSTGPKTESDGSCDGSTNADTLPAHNAHDCCCRVSLGSRALKDDFLEAETKSEDASDEVSLSMMVQFCFVMARKESKTARQRPSQNSIRRGQEQRGMVRLPRC